jgi:hypothetical protein
VPTTLRITQAGQARVRRRPLSYGGKVAPALRLLLVHWAGKGATKALRFTPRFPNLTPKAGEPGCHVDDDECDHGYRPAFIIKRLI